MVNGTDARMLCALQVPIAMLLWRGPEPLRDQPLIVPSQLPPHQHTKSAAAQPSAGQPLKGRPGTSALSAQLARRAHLPLTAADSVAADGRRQFTSSGPASSPAGNFSEAPAAAHDLAAAAAAAASKALNEAQQGAEDNTSYHPEVVSGRQTRFAALDGRQPRSDSPDPPARRPFSELAALSIPGGRATGEDDEPASPAVESPAVSATAAAQSPGFGSPVDTARSPSPGSPGSIGARTRSFGSPLELPKESSDSFRSAGRPSGTVRSVRGPADSFSRASPSLAPDQRDTSDYRSRTPSTGLEYPAAEVRLSGADLGGGQICGVAAGPGTAEEQDVRAKRAAHQALAQQLETRFRQRFKDRRRSGGGRIVGTFLVWLLVWGGVLMALSELFLRHVPQHRCSGLLRCL